MTIRQKLINISNVALCFVRKWWRPITALWFSGAVFVNGIWLPLATSTPADLMALSALVTAVTASFAVREWGKVKGVADDDI